MSYTDFLARKAQLRNAGGFEPLEIPAHLFDFQRLLLDFAAEEGLA